MTWVASSAVDGGSLPSRCCSADFGADPGSLWRILHRNGLNRLAWVDRPTGKVIRRYERAHPGELGHLDISEVGKIPSGAAGRPAAGLP